MRFLFFLLFLLAGTAPLKATPADEYFFRYSPDCANAYESYLALKLPEGAAFLRRAVVSEPGNLMPVFLADYEDCLLLMLNGDAREYAQRRGHYEERLDWMDKGLDTSPWQRLAKGILHFHWALVHVRFGERVRAALAFRKSYLNLKENAKRFPAFPYTAVFLGFEEAIAGTVPDDYRWIAAVFGVKGSVAKGMNSIGRFLEGNRAPQTPFRNEATLFYVYLRFYLLQQQEGAWKYVCSDAFGPTENLLHALVSANISLNYRKADVALQSLRAAQAFPESRRFPVLDYELGYVLLHRLDVTGAMAAFERYLAASPGAWYRKDATQKIAWLYLLSGKPEKAAEKLKAVLRTGNAFVDADKGAQRTAEGSNLPEPALLSARLLCDGGYYGPALQKLQAIPPKILQTSALRLEYAFRMGRAYEGLSQYPKAVVFYNTAYEKGQESREQFSARAALQLAFLYERSGDAARAKQWFYKVLALRSHDFQASIDQQAKAGLGRLGE